MVERRKPDKKHSGDPVDVLQQKESEEVGNPQNKPKGSGKPATDETRPQSGDPVDTLQQKESEEVGNPQNKTNK
jgi:hypothetical protein